MGWDASGVVSECTLTHVHTPYTAGAVTRFEKEYKSHLRMNKMKCARIWKVQARERCWYDNDHGL